MALSENEKAGLAASMVVAQAAAASTGPVGIAAFTAASAIVNGVMAAADSGKEYTLADWNLALSADDAAKADDLKAQAGN